MVELCTAVVVQQHGRLQRREIISRNVWREVVECCKAPIAVLLVMAYIVFQSSQLNNAAAAPPTPITTIPTNSGNRKPIQIDYAISLIECTDHHKTSSSSSSTAELLAHAIGHIITKTNNKQCKSAQRAICDNCNATITTTTTPLLFLLEEIYSFHYYTACQKPWSCNVSRTNDPKKKSSIPRKKYYDMPLSILQFDHCMKSPTAFRRGRRFDLERTLDKWINYDDELILKQARTKIVDYKKEFFYGHCTEDFIIIPPATNNNETKIPELFYGNAKLKKYAYY